MSLRRVLVTGASGYLGSQVVAALAARGDLGVAALDVRVPAQRLPGVTYEIADVRSPQIDGLFARLAPQIVVHLASIVTPGRDSSREFEYSVDVEGTRNLLDACVRHGVRRIIVSSSGAAYGYHADNPPRLSESAPLRGNRDFAYSWHKRLVEEMLADYRRRHPSLEQVVFRIGTILGATVRNQITDLFDKPRLIAVQGSDSPFVFVHDRDVVGAILHGVDSPATGIYNVAGDGVLTIRQIAAKLGKRCVVLPPCLLRLILRLLKSLRLTQYGPEQLDFLRYRPVLDNTRLKREFGYVPRLDSAQAFEVYLESRRDRHGA
jgi:UDP-glucose 4-epimerase